MFNIYMRRASEVPSAPAVEAAKVLEPAVCHESLELTITSAALEDPREAQNLINQIKEFCDCGGSYIHVKADCVPFQKAS